MVFVASCAGASYALERASGDFRWTYDTRQDGGRAEFHGTSVVLDDVIITATDDRRKDGIGHVYAFERKNGSVRWKRRVAVGVMTDLVRLGDALYYASLEEEVVALDIATGDVKWTFASGVGNERHFATSTPAVTARRVFFGGVDGVVHALDRATGKPLWRRELGDRVSTAVLADGVDLLLGTADGRLHRLRQDDGATIATLEIEGIPFGRPLALDRTLIVLSTGGAIRAVDASLAGLRWEEHIESEWATFRPIAIGDTVLAGADDERVHAFRGKDGKALWSQEFGGPVTSLTDAGEILFVGNTRGLVFACERP